MVNSYYDNEELQEIGFLEVGSHVLISRKVSIYSPSTIAIGDNVRVDDFTILSGKINLGSNIHISAFCGLYGSAGITIKDNSGLSPQTLLFSASDDFSGRYLVGAQFPNELRGVKSAPINISKFVQLGAQCIVFPGVNIEEGVSVGSMSLVNKDLLAWNIYKGIPAKLHCKRSKEILQKIDIFNGNN